ncbi:signal peptide-containing protein [Theileria equi strain WA]|uniref:Signal peptide-containing protein n=1 Tax=Theileria equi strain WA TaxID=1537102 RepID=L0AVT1_THEEQ|nr:signal peptide-containing protein [Theileria equi strain WA]AFZ79712.1 signal peptide-containing protein [Theileria equi strain WA]|eukprot:XP_004829378.1 signal peptide-containing protein [Theileria equi strain WA]
MKALAVLFAVYLLGQCQCGNDDDEEIGPWNENVSTYEYHYDGNDVMLIIPKRGVSIYTVACGTSEIWSQVEGQEFEYLKCFMKHGEPMALLVAKSQDGYATGRWYARDGNKWKNSIKASKEVITGLKVLVPERNKFVLDLDYKEDIEECRIFEISFFESPMRVYYANNGYCSTEVVFSGAPVWKGTNGSVCVACDAYLKDGKPTLILLVIITTGNSVFKHFERNEKDEWSEISDHDFTTRAEAFRTYKSSKGYKMEKEFVLNLKPAKPWWIRSFNAVTRALSRPRNVPFSPLEEDVSALDK